MKSLPETAYGLILAFDGYDAAPNRCNDVNLLYRLLQQLPLEIGMRPLGFPQIVSVDEPGIRGLSGFTFIMESHISIHTYEERGFVTADVYSCKAFDTKKAARLLQNAFNIKRIETQVITRGSEFKTPSVVP